MYNDYFGFRDSPFTATPNSRFFYTNDMYREALANLRYGIGWKKGLIVMSGEVGTGKTTLLGMTMRSLETTIHPVFISYDHLTYIELLRLISRELGLPCNAQDRLETVEQLREYLIAQHRKGHIVALLIDEAQNLSEEMFEDIRLLSNFETEAEKLLQIVLTGQPELEAKLDQPNFRHIKQRIVIHCRLAPLQNEEVAPYINVRLQEAGHDGTELFSTDAVAEIARYSGGIPRLVNIICDNALLLAFAASRNKVTAEMIHEVARDLGLEKKSQVEHSAAPVADERAEEDVPAVAFTPFSAGTKIQTPLMRDHKIHLTWITAGLALALVAIGGAGGAFYSRHARNDLRQAPAAEDSFSLRNSMTNEISQKEQKMAATGAASSADKAFELKAITSERENSSVDTQAEAKKQSALGTFEVVGPFSFVRDTPRSNAKIIATLQPLNKVKVLSVRGEYLQVNSVVEGRTIHGYVHQEDAFFDRPKKSRQRKN